VPQELCIAFTSVEQPTIWEGRKYVERSREDDERRVSSENADKRRRNSSVGVTLRGPFHGWEKFLRR
jgi:hypothetical protein